MAALVQYSRKLEPLPERFRDMDRADFTVPECNTRVDIFPEVREDGRMHFYADVNVRQSPTVAQRSCVAKWARRNGLKAVFVNMDFSAG